MQIQQALQKLLDKQNLSTDEMHSVMRQIMSGGATDAQIGGFLIALRCKGETVDEMASAAEVIRELANKVPVVGDHIVDTCGTGGDGAHTINVSTGAAIVVAACGVRVAKHGNRSVSSRCGSADVVEALGIPTDLGAEKQSAVLRAAGIAFLMAPAHHPALRHAAAARRELGVRTIFNALGPLVNPARATHQLVGVYDDGLRVIAAAALGRLGARRAWVVRSEDGLDELSPAAPTRVSVVEDGRVEERVVTPEDFGVERIDLKALAGGDAAENAKVLEAILGGEAHAATEAIVLNAAAALVVARGLALREAADTARAAIREGKAIATLAAWRAAAK